MEAITSVLKTTSRVTRKRTTKSNISTQPKESGSKRRRGKNMQKQQVALAISMKENCTVLQQGTMGGGGGGTATSAATGGEIHHHPHHHHQQQPSSHHLVQSRLQPIILNAKENVGQSHSTSSISTRSRRQQQQQQQLCSLQCTEMEVIGGGVGSGEGDGDCLDGCLNPSIHLSSVGHVNGSGPIAVGRGGGSATCTLTAGNVAPALMDHPNHYAANTLTSYGSLTVLPQQPSSLATTLQQPLASGVPMTVGGTHLPTKQQQMPFVDFHRHQTTTNVASGIHMLQGGSLHHPNSSHLHQHQPTGIHALEVSQSTPLPNLQWTQSSDLWRKMRAKDVTKVAPETELRLHHPGILPNMRVILLDWMMEVCEEYKLHRETYYLAVDLYDRFMDIQTGIQKEQLQLIGVTCLFIASKIEEIYPPKVTEFAYVTDGACTVSNILDTELFICKALNWKLNHHVVTVNTWVNTYMQLTSHHLRPSGIKAKEFEYPAYSGMEFVRVMQLLDLCMLDIASRQFSSSVLAASAVYLASERTRPHLEHITGLQLSDIHVCVNWMQSCATVLSQKGPIKQRTFGGVIPQDSHNIQTHEVSISMLDDASELRKSQESLQSQLTLLQECSVFMTPPRPERKCLAPINTAC